MTNYVLLVSAQPRSRGWTLHCCRSAELCVSNVGVVCERAIMRRASQSSDTMEHHREGVGEQEPHYFTFEVSWEVANKGMSCEIFANCAFAGTIGAYICTPPSCLLWYDGFSKL